MLSVEKWFESTFVGMTDNEASSARMLRILADNTVALKHRCFSIPLASGTGSGLLLTPQNSAKNLLCIMLHDFGENPPLWHWAVSLIERGFSVLLLSWDGHGKGQSLLDFGTATRSLSLVLQKLYSPNATLAAEFSGTLPKCFLVGNSFGATMAMLAAARPENSHLINAVIAVSPMLVVHKARYQLGESLSLLRVCCFFKDVLPNISLYGSSIINKIIGRTKMGKHGVRLRVSVDPMSQMQAFLKENIENRQILQQIKVPVLWLHGARDNIVPVNKILPLMMAIPSALFIHIDKIRGHYLMSLSDQIAQYISHFIDKQVECSQAQRECE